MGIPCYYELLDTNHQCPNFSTSILILDIKHEDSDEDMPLAKRKTDKKRKAQVHTKTNRQTYRSTKVAYRVALSLN